VHTNPPQSRKNQLRISTQNIVLKFYGLSIRAQIRTYRIVSVFSRLLGVLCEMFHAFLG
jgi:hypothetical protein